MPEWYDVALRGYDGVLSVGLHAFLDELPAEGDAITFEDGLEVVVEDVTTGAHGKPVLTVSSRRRPAIRGMARLNLGSPEAMESFAAAAGFGSLAELLGRRGLKRSCEALVRVGARSASI
jgi:hypothetical protein